VNSTFMEEACDSCPITEPDIVLAFPRRIQRVGSLVRLSLRQQASANRVTAASLDCSGERGQKPNQEVYHKFNFP
jgi:hypothetical protein